MFETRNPDKPLRDLESPDEDLSEPSDFDYSLAGKRRFGKRRGGSKERIEGSSLVSICLKKRIAIRLDEECLDLSPEFCAVLIENLASFADEIQKFCYDIARTKELFRCCVLSSVLEFYDFQYCKEVSEVTTLVHSLIQTES